MTGPAPAEYGWWLASRAAGITALVCITLAVGIGLALGGKVASKKPGLPRVLMAIHEHAALVGLVAVAVHGITLLGDAWLKASVVDIAVPFASDVKPFFVGLGVVGGYLAAVLGLTFYARKRIGMKLWRRAHRATILVYALAVAHTLGAGTDATEPWLRTFMLVSGAPILFLFTMRVLPRDGVVTVRWQRSASS
jgi:methionine sulfoxide reductase heme-binding subunit